MTPRNGYHHGDLRNALLTATMDVVRERGPRGLSVSEVARRAGVSTAAPYRHFAGKDALLAAVAQKGFIELEHRFSGLALGPTLEARAIGIAAAYTEFAQEDPARFDVMFAAGLDKDSHRDLLRQAERVQGQLEAALAPFIVPEQLVQRSAELWAIAHGVTALALAGSFAHVADAQQVGEVAASAAAAWANGLAG
ncbi:TetR/AcrR family transcriptional regulator [Streptomyces fimicarius]|uniref:TetR/AcrR family transcriptional regulator n=1 Tax=Streptomyces griseus TaxID=1911 RepID=UPI0036767FC5